VLFVTRLLTLHVPYDKVNTVEYGQHVSRRYAEAILLSPLISAQQVAQALRDGGLHRRERPATGAGDAGG
jgi:hypothetical protein